MVAQLTAALDRDGVVILKADAAARLAAEQLRQVPSSKHASLHAEPAAFPLLANPAIMSLVDAVIGQQILCQNQEHGLQSVVVPPGTFTDGIVTRFRPAQLLSPFPVVVRVRGGKGEPWEFWVGC